MKLSFRDTVTNVMAKNWFQALRGLRRRPVHAITTIVVLALGIGAAATLFSVVDTVLLKPLPLPDANRLVLVLEANPTKHQNASLLAPARLNDWNAMNEAFKPGTGLAGMYTESETDTSGAEPERLAGMRVSPGFFGVLEAKPLLGRTFTTEEDKPVVGPGPVVISYGFWTQRYHRDPNVLGKHLVFQKAAWTIVGVMPPLGMNAGIDLWLPARLPDFLVTAPEARSYRFYTGIGRMKPGVTLAQAGADLARIEAQLGRKYPSTDAGWSAQITPLKDYLVGSSATTLWAIFGATLVLLLLAVANIAGLTLAQLQGRTRELAIRSALGASRGQVAATVLREAAWLALAGAAGGAALAWVGTRAAAALEPGTMPRMAELGFDWRGWAFAVAISAVAVLGFGLGPALAATRTRLGALLVSLSAGAPGGRRRVQRALVAGQLALTVLLLASAGLLLRSYWNLTQVQGGFDARHVVTFHVSASWNEDRKQLATLQQRLLNAFRGMPGVEAAGFTNFLPASNATLQYQFKIAGLPGTDAQGAYSLGERTITPGYLEALSVPVKQGSYCPALAPGFNFNNMKAVVNQSFVDRYMAGQGSVVGRYFHALTEPPNAPPEQIVGVIGNVREDSLNTAASPFLYLCMPYGAWPDPDYVVKTAGGPGATMAAIRGVVSQVAPGRAVFDLDRLETVVDKTLEQPKLEANFLLLFAGFALLLAAVGLYSLISLMVTGRRREMGVRMALGARPGQVAGIVMASTGKLLLWGAGAGLVLTWAADRLLHSLLYGVGPLDLLSLVAAIVVLSLVAGLAAWLPARRAAATDPVIALRD